jgi:hypothetical protein
MVARIALGQGRLVGTVLVLTTAIACGSGGGSSSSRCADLSTCCPTVSVGDQSACAAVASRGDDPVCDQMLSGFQGEAECTMVCFSDGLSCESDIECCSGTCSPGARRCGQVADAGSKADAGSSGSGSGGGRRDAGGGVTQGSSSTKSSSRAGGSGGTGSGSGGGISVECTEYASKLCGCESDPASDCVTNIATQCNGMEWLPIVQCTISASSCTAAYACADMDAG